MTVCESDSGLCWDLDEETLARAILTFCLNTADALMTALLKGTADAWEALTLIRDSDPELRTSAGAGKVIEQAFCIGMTRWGSKPTPQAVRSFRSALATWQQRLRTLPTWDRDYLCGWFTMEGRQWIIAPHDVWWPTRLNDLALLGRCAPPLCLWGSGDRAALTSCPQPVGIVGSRGVNEYGRRLTTDIAVQAAQAGHLVVSGGAMGADAAAHRGALDAMRAYGIGQAGVRRRPQPCRAAVQQRVVRRDCGKRGSTGQRTVPGNHSGGEAVPVAQPHHSRAFVNAGGHSGETAFRGAEHRELGKRTAAGHPCGARQH